MLLFILPADPVFEIDNQRGVLSLLTTLDRESHAFFSLIISARDQGTPSLSASVSPTHPHTLTPSHPHTLTPSHPHNQVVVSVNVSDANDNHPIFSIPPGGYSARLSEDSPPGSEVVTVVATDRDSGIHSQITYSLRDPSVPFRIQNPAVRV